MKKFVVVIVMALTFALGTTGAAEAAPADGPALQAKTLRPVCANSGDTKVRVGVKNVGKKSVRSVTVWWKTDSATSSETVFRFGRTILAHHIAPESEVEFYVYPTKRPNRILLHDTVTAIC